MKTFIYWEVREPYHEKRREVLGQLAQLRKYPDLKDVKRELRQQLRRTEGHVGYYLFYKGLRYFLGDEFKSNKYSMMTLNPDIIMTDLKNKRQMAKLSLAGVKKVLIPSMDQYMHIHTVDGFPTEQQPYVQLTKRI